CWGGAKDEEVPSEQSVPVEEARTSKAGPLTEKTHPHEKGFCFIANLCQYQKHDSGEKIFKMDMDRASLVISCRFHVSGKPFTCEEGGKDFLALSGLLQHQATPNGEKPHGSVKCRESFNSGK
ncbi:hypothetical protein MC885_002793, partial [Smutsia gigantea]